MKKVITVLTLATVIPLTYVTSHGDHSFVETLRSDLHGFADTRIGVRTQNDPDQGDASLGEVRIQLETEQYLGPVTANLRADLLYDGIENNTNPDLETGHGWVDLREANLLFSPLPSMDVKLGRQILTWGTGDLLFINDLFPKDFVSFFTGRDEEYLKAPSDALFISLFHEWANLDLAYTPRFDADRFLSGNRISFFNPMTGGRIGENNPVLVDPPDTWFSDDEIALRLSRNLGGTELAAYGYHGFWKSPKGADPTTGSATFPRLQAFGVSARTQVGQGIGHAEAGYYDSLDDREGNDPFTPNSETRLLVGYEQEVVRNLTASVQYYLEVLMDHDKLVQTLPVGQPLPDEDRHVVTLRLTQLMWNQNLTLSLFTFYSPSDQDGYLRPAVSYKVTDNWLLTAGGNHFFGNQDTTFFGQFDDNSNLYAGTRYSF